jgi:hypothetical protein
VFRTAEKTQTPIRTELVYNFCLESDRDVELLRWAIRKEIKSVGTKIQFDSRKMIDKRLFSDVDETTKNNFIDQNFSVLILMNSKHVCHAVERAELFRSTSPCSVLLDVVMRKYGQKLLQQILGPIVEEAIILVGERDDEGFGPAYFELDSTRCSSPREHEEALGNIMKVYTLSQKLMASILSSASDWPRFVTREIVISPASILISCHRLGRSKKLFLSFVKR